VPRVDYLLLVSSAPEQPRDADRGIYTGRVYSALAGSGSIPRVALSDAEAWRHCIDAAKPVKRADTASGRRNSTRNPRDGAFERFIRRRINRIPT